MVQRVWQQIWNNLGSLLLAFALAVAVWISAVVAEDPNEERAYPRTIQVEVRNQDPGMVVRGELPSQVSLTLSAPRSLWDRLLNDSDPIRAFIDLAGLEAGEHILPIEIESRLRPVRIVAQDPEEVTLSLEARVTQSFSIDVVVEGEPVLGFEAEAPSVLPDEASVSGPQSLMVQVAAVQATVNIEGLRASLQEPVDLQAVDAEGNVIAGVTIEPETATVEQAITQAGGYREVAVNVLTIGLPASGFRVVSIIVDPPIVTLFSTDTELIQNLPGFVSTEPLQLTSVEEDIETRLSLDLPEGVSISGEQQSVAVRVGIAPIESSIPLSVQMESIGLTDGLVAEFSPQTINVILSGPISELESLQPGDVRLFVDLTGLDVGAHLLEPQAEILPDNIQVLSITPASLEVVISRDSASN